MKVKRKVVSLVCLTMLVAMSLAGCGKHKPATKDSFAEVMTDKGFEVVDQSSMITDGSDFSVVYLAQPKDETKEKDEKKAETEEDETGLFTGQYQVEFYQFDDEDKCEASYDKLDDELVAAYKNASGYSTTEKNTSHFSKRTVKTDGRYYVISRVENTLVIAISPLDESKTIDSVLKELDYK